MPRLHVFFAGLLATSALHAQNTCSTALPVGLGSHVVAAVDGPEVPSPNCTLSDQGTTNASVWYSFTSPIDTVINISTATSGVDTRFHVYTGSCGALACYSGDDDSGPSQTSTATFSVIADVVYLIAFDNRWTAEGFMFEITQAEPLAPGSITFVNAPLPTANGYYIGLVDMNNDALDDVLIVGGASIGVIEQGPSATLELVTYPTPGVQHQVGFSVAVGDLDGNGHNDVEYGGGGGVSFMMANDDGTGFTELAFPQSIAPQRGNLVDVNNDGALDGFMTHDFGMNAYYLNDGSGNFSFVQGTLGLTSGNYGSIWTDYDNDGDQDLYLSKCGGAVADDFFRNDGDGVFTNVASELGFADNEQSWSSAVGDFDNDGDQDIMVGSSTGANFHKLMRNNGDGTFTNVTAGSGFDGAIGTNIEWNARDFNNDGYLDIIGSNWIHYGNGDLTFTPNVTAAYNGPIGDLNNDGFLDLIYGLEVRYNQGNANNHLTVTLEGTVSNPSGIGARVRVTSALGTQTREIRSGEGFRYMCTLNAHFGLGADTEIGEVRVYWPSGIVDVIDAPAINGVLNIVEGLSTGLTTARRRAPLVVFPNPASDMLTLSGAVQFRNDRAEVVDLTGRVVLSASVTNGRLDIASLAPGRYVVRLLTGGDVLEAQFAKL